MGLLSTGQALGMKVEVATGRWGRREQGGIPGCLSIPLKFGWGMGCNKWVLPREPCPVCRYRMLSGFQGLFVPVAVGSRVMLCWARRVDSIHRLHHALPKLLPARAVGEPEELLFRAGLNTRTSLLPEGREKGDGAESPHV